MCKDNSVPSESGSNPALRLEAKKGAWRIALDVVGGRPEVELSASAIRLQLQDSSSAASKAMTLPVPAEAQPLDFENAKCSFSSKRSELCIEWPQKLLTATASSDAETTASESEADVKAESGHNLTATRQACAAAEAAEAAKQAEEERVAREAAEAAEAAKQAEEERVAREAAEAAEAAKQAEEERVAREAADAAEAAKQAEEEREAAEAAEAAKQAEEKQRLVREAAEAAKQAEEELLAREAAEAARQAEVPAAEADVSGEEWRTRGNAAVKSSDFEEAIRCYSAGLAAGDGDEALLCSNRALCLCQLGRNEEGLEDAKRCVALRPDFFKGFVRGARALRALGRPKEALDFLKKCPKHDEAETLAGQLRPEAEAAEAARIASLSGCERTKEEGNALFKRGMFEAAAEKYSAALKECDDQECGMALAIRNNRAACFHQLSDYHSVVKDTSFVLQRDPCNFKALSRRMLALEPLERYEAALEDARAVLRQDPRNDVANKIQHRLGKLVRDLQRNAS